MPLKSGSSKKAIQQNIKELIGSGRKPDQAAAIAYDKTVKGRKSSNKPKKGGY